MSHNTSYSLSGSGHAYKLLSLALSNLFRNLQELLKQALQLETKFGQTSFDDTVLDVLHTLERVHREHGDLNGANRWLTAIGERLRTNALKMLDALAGKPLFADERSVAAKMAEVDRYLQSRATAQLGALETASPSWNLPRRIGSECQWS